MYTTAITLLSVMAIPDKERNMKSRTWVWMTAVSLLAALAIPVQVAAQNALGLKYTVLYTFTGGTDGANPNATVIQDEAGNLYATTIDAGDLSACVVTGFGTGCGTVFKLDPEGNYIALYSFTGGTDGANSSGDLIRDNDGNLYGTTTYGGTSNYGVVFEVDPSGKETTLYSFTGGADGVGPFAGLVRDENGNLYGTTAFGGASGAGVVFKVDPSGKETVLYTFTGGADGANPYGDLIRDPDGNLYGTTYGGGTSNAGTVFKVDPTNKESVLYSFTGGADGARPFAGLVRDEAGNLYGTASMGGTSGWGVVFKVDPTNKESVLYSFTNGTDGGALYGGLVRDSQGNLYGTTFFGGDLSGCGGVGCGVVFKLNPAGKEIVLYSFTGGADGANSYASLLRDNVGNLYGTTGYGGDLSSPQGWCAGIGCGVVFKISACSTALCQGQ